MAKIDKNIRIITPCAEHDFDNDKRFLIPFVQGGLIGFANKSKEVVISAKFAIVLDDFNHEFSLVRVGGYFPVSCSDKSGSISVYVHKRYGLIDHHGNYIIPMEYEGLSKPYYGYNDRYTARSLSNGYAVFSETGQIIVPFGRYDYIGGFDSGYARVKKGYPGSLEHEGDVWGIIDESGQEIVPVQYKRIGRFYQKNLEYTFVEDDDNRFEFDLRDGQLKYDGAHSDEIQRLIREEEDWQSLCRYKENQSDVENLWNDDFPM